MTVLTTSQPTTTPTTSNDGSENVATHDHADDVHFCPDDGAENVATHDHADGSLIFDVLYF
jgi:hypothetical protein